MGARTELRAICRRKWGPDWFKVNPVIKKARLQYAENLSNAPDGKKPYASQRVLVHEHDCSYVV